MAESTRVDAQQQRLLFQLREAGGRPVRFAELHAAGVDFPAAVAAELEVAGYPIERVPEAGLRLVSPDPMARPGAPARRRWPWTRRRAA